MVEWEKGPKELKLTTNGVTESRTGYEAELVTPNPRYHGKEYKPRESHVDAAAGRRATIEESIPRNATTSLRKQKIADAELIVEDPGNETIHNLILTVKAPNCVSALSSIKQRLNRNSTILFLQNGMGIVEEVNEKVFPDVETRPNYMVGINSHGTNDSDKFTTNHAGYGTIALGLFPHESIVSRDTSSPAEYSSAVWGWAHSSRYLLRTLTRTPVLCATGFPHSELLQLQLEKLALNAILNPLTCLLDTRNGGLLYNYPITRVVRLLLSEISLVIRSLPELSGLPNVNTRFGPDRLETLAVAIAAKTKDNISSMLADVRAGRQTEIEYINGYVVKRGEEQGVKCVMNYMVWQLVRGKQGMVAWEQNEDLPFVRMPPVEE